MSVRVSASAQLERSGAMPQGAVQNRNMKDVSNLAAAAVVHTHGRRGNLASRPCMHTYIQRFVAMFWVLERQERDGYCESANDGLDYCRHQPGTYEACSFLFHAPSHDRTWTSLPINDASAVCSLAEAEDCILVWGLCKRERESLHGAQRIEMDIARLS